MTKPTLVTAIHEAGHAVARLANHPGPMIRYMAVTDLPEGTLGHVALDARFLPGPTHPDGDVDQLVRKTAKLDVIESLAGPVAELRQRWGDWATVELHGLELSKHFPFGDIPENDDLSQVQVRLDWLYGEAAADALRDVWIETVELVHRHWKRIDELGRWLLDRGRLEGEEIYEWWAKQLLAA